MTIWKAGYLFIYFYEDRLVEYGYILACWVWLMCATVMYIPGR